MFCSEANNSILLPNTFTFGDEFRAGATVPTHWLISGHSTLFSLVKVSLTKM